MVFCYLIGHWYTSLLLALGFVFLFQYLRQKFGLLIWDPFFLMEKFTAVSFSLSTALPASHKFCLIVCCVFIFIYLKVFPKLLLISSVTLWLFRSVLFDFHVFVNVPKFCYWFLIPLLSEIILCVASVILSELRFVLWPSMWWSLENAHVYLKRMNIIQLLGGGFCRYVSCSYFLSCESDTNFSVCFSPPTPNNSRAPVGVLQFNAFVIVCIGERASAAMG